MVLSSQLPRPRSAASPRTVLLIVCAGVVMASLDLFIVNVALPSIAHDFGSGLGSLSWVLNGYAIVYAALLVFFGKLADGRRRDRAFLSGVAIFTVASAACAASTGVGMLVAFRLVQAAGAALLTPTSLALVLAAYPAERRQGAVRAWTAAGGMAAALGPVAGGLLVAVNWRWVFLVNVPVGLAAMAAGWKLLPQVAPAARQRADLLGASLLTAGVAGLILGLVEASSWGWGSARLISVLAVSVLALGGFVQRVRTAADPLVAPSLFARREFRGAVVVAALFSMGFGAMLLSIVLYMQNAWGWSALKCGLGIAPGPVMVPLMSFLVVPRLLPKLGASKIIAAGTILLGAAMVWWALAVTGHADYPVAVLGGMVLTGIGVGLALPTFMATGSSSLPAPSFAAGSAVILMVRQLGLAIGVAVLVAVLGTHGGHSVIDPTSLRRAWLVGAGMAVSAAIPAAVMLRRRSAVPISLPERPPVPEVAAVNGR